MLKLAPEPSSGHDEEHDAGGQLMRPANPQLPCNQQAWMSDPERSNSNSIASYKKKENEDGRMCCDLTMTCLSKAAMLCKFAMNQRHFGGGETCMTCHAGIVRVPSCSCRSDC